MKLTTFCLGFALGLLGHATHAAQLTTQIVLLDSVTYAPLPTSGPNTYQLALGQTFVVQLQGVVNNPNITDSLKNTAVRFKQLGIQNVAGRLLTSAVNVAVPVADPGVPFPTWSNFVEYIGSGNPGFVNVFDGDSDGDLDAVGVGTANAALSLSSAGQLPGVQVGALGMTPFFDGWYQYQGGNTHISFIAETVKLYIDPTTGVNAALSVEDGLGSYIGSSVFIGIPEPSTIALAGLGLVGLIVAMRRKAV